jgi:hypothetical protein
MKKSKRLLKRLAEIGAFTAGAATVATSLMTPQQPDATPDATPDAPISETLKGEEAARAYATWTNDPQIETMRRPVRVHSAFGVFDVDVGYHLDLGDLSNVRYKVELGDGTLGSGELTTQDTKMSETDLLGLLAQQDDTVAANNPYAPDEIVAGFPRDHGILRFISNGVWRSVPITFHPDDPWATEVYNPLPTRADTSVLLGSTDDYRPASVGSFRPYTAYLHDQFGAPIHFAEDSAPYDAINRFAMVDQRLQALFGIYFVVQSMFNLVKLVDKYRRKQGTPQLEAHLVGDDAMQVTQDGAPLTTIQADQLDLERLDIVIYSDRKLKSPAWSVAAVLQ